MDDAVNRPRLSIVIVSWNVAADLEECLKSVLEADRPKDNIEVIVVENASTDDTKEVLRTKFPMVRVIENSENLGFAVANNQGIGSSLGRFVLVLNPDTLVERDTLVQCLAYIEAHPEIGVLGCKLVYTDGRIQHECARRFPALMDAFLASMYLHLLFPKNRLFGRSLMTYWDHEDSREIPCISGAFMLLRRQALDEVGLFDASAPMYLDDVDLCYRMAHYGWHTYYLASVKIVHKGGRSESSAGRIRDPLGATARYAFFLKHYGRGKASVFRAIMLFRGLYRLGLTCLSLPLRLFGLPHRAILTRLQVSRQLALLRWVFASRPTLGND